MANQKLPLLDRFMQYVSPEPNTGCWLWLGASTTDGYGCFMVGSRKDGSRHLDLAHRVAYGLYTAPIPNGAHILHKCDTPVCVNPDHLFLGSPQANASDRALKGRSPRSSVGLPVGVRFNWRNGSKPFYARVKFHGIQYHVGTFPTAEGAGEAAREYRDKLYAENGGRARWN